MQDSKLLLGIDWGEKRIGLAMGESSTALASPYGVADSLEAVLSVVKKEEVDEIVLGRPYKMKSIDHELDERFDVFLIDLKNSLDLPIHLVDERLSSKQADALIGDKKTKASRDAVAAMLILQSYFDLIKDEK